MNWKFDKYVKITSKLRILQYKTVRISTIDNAEPTWELFPLEVIFKTFSLIFFEKFLKNDKFAFDIF